MKEETVGDVLDQYEKAAVIGFWRSGASSQEISAILSIIHEDEIDLVIQAYMRYELFKQSVIYETKM